MQVLSKLKPVKNAVVSFTKRNSSNILVGLGVGGYLTAIVMGCKATPAAEERLKLAKQKKQQELTVVEKTKAVAPVYWPTAAIAAASTACIVGSKIIDYRKHAALVAAYELCQENLKDVQKSIVETVGEKKAKAIKDNVAKNKVIENPPKDDNIIFTGYGDSLCYDSVSGRYFKTNYEKIYQAELSINKRLLSENYILLNEFYDLIGLPDIEIGSRLGFNGYMFGEGMEISYSSQLTENKIPCMVINYDIVPVEFEFDYH